MLFAQFVGALAGLEALVRRLTPYPTGSTEFWYAAGFGLSFLPALWSALTVLGLWLALGALDVAPRGRLVACTLLAVASHQLPLRKTAYDGVFLGTVAIFAVWSAVRAGQCPRGSVSMEVLVTLLAALGTATKESGLILGFPLAALFVTGHAGARAKTRSLVQLGGGLMLGVAMRAAWNVAMATAWSHVHYVGNATTVAAWGVAGYSLERLATKVIQMGATERLSIPTPYRLTNSCASVISSNATSEIGLTFPSIPAVSRCATSTRWANSTRGCRRAFSGRAMGSGCGVPNRVLE